MADTKIINLTAYTEVEAIDTDLFVIEDVTNNITKKMTMTEARKLLLAKEVEARLSIVLLDNETSLAVEDGVGEIYYVIPSWLDGMELTDAQAAVATASSSGNPTFQIYNVDNAVDMLTTRITIDATELTSYDATTAAVIDTTNDVVNTGDRLRFDCDVTGTGTKGLTIFLEFSEV